ncbi:MAG: hypothetical protein OXM02_09385 [Bacteroidota bacterium]|nr:hypothetical protein [Bacteroidota bacterium]MDE2834714.1 hypothetical protein [Bacteroidota bacterium]MDE2956658.1 hypothetical protein [Bacteroidota bacterium]
MQSSLTSILIGGLACALLSTAIHIGSTLANASGPNLVLGIVFGCLGCLVGLTSGLIAVWHYTSEKEVTLSRSTGVKMGALAGLVSALTGFLMVRALMIMGVLPTADDAIDQMMQNPALENSDAGMETAMQVTEIMMGWGGLVVTLIFGPLLGLLGGMIGAALFKKGEPSDTEFADGR